MDSDVKGTYRRRQANNGSNNQRVEFAGVLERFGLQFTTGPYHHYIGSMTNEQYFEFHFTSVISTVYDLLVVLIPALKEYALHFKVPVDLITAKHILNGSLGYSEIGKIITVVIPASLDVSTIIGHMAALTESFVGPPIPGEARVSGIIYTTAEPGTEGGISDELYKFPKKKLNKKYQVIDVLKSDVKGSVLLGMYVSGFFRVKRCVIKEGKRHMWSDMTGRDITNRLEWQHRIHGSLAGVLNVPKIIDFFVEDGNSYFVMEFIKGRPLDQVIGSIFKGRRFVDLSLGEQKQLLDLLYKIIEIIETLHRKSYVHRDLSPANFLITASGKIYLIDLEFAYNIKEQFPTPVFSGGTIGFMSRQQLNDDVPDHYEDIYGLCALMIVFFTNLPPLKFLPNNQRELMYNIGFFIGSLKYATPICSGLERNRQARPSLGELKQHIEQIRMQLKYGKLKSEVCKREDRAYRVLDAGMRGLTIHRFHANGRLFAVQDQADLRVSNTARTYSGGGVLSPITSILYLIDLLDNRGLPPTLNKLIFKNILAFKNDFLPRIADLPEGLLAGNAGMAIALSSALKIELVPSNEEFIHFLKDCFRTISNSLDLCEGIAGQGLALLYSRQYLPTNDFDRLAHTFQHILLTPNMPQKLWNLKLMQGAKQIPSLGLAQGASGVVLFLIELYKAFPTEHLEKTIFVSLETLITELHNLKWLSQTKTAKDYSFVNGSSGIALTFIHAFKLFKKTIYQQTAESLLTILPKRPVPIDFTVLSGISGWGIVYQEAYAAFGSPIWKERSIWIENVLINTYKQAWPNAGYWNMDGVDNYDSSLLMGTTGVLVFLNRQFKMVI